MSNIIRFGGGGSGTIVNVGSGARGDSGTNYVSITKNYSALFCIMYSAVGNGHNDGYPYCTISCDGGTGKTNVVTKGGNATPIFGPGCARFQNPYPAYMNLNGAWAVYENVPAGSTVAFTVSIDNTKSNYDTYYAVYGVE